MEWDSKSLPWNAMSKLELRANMFPVDLNLGRLEQMGEIPMNSRAFTLTSSSSSSPTAKRGRPRSTGQNIVYCCVDGCFSDLSHGREYHRRHRVCERHSKTPFVLIGGKEQRFCQQCSRFHSLGEFDESKRSCRKRLDGHNRRRRKSNTENIYMSNSGVFQTSNTERELLQFRNPDNWPMITDPEKALNGIDHPVSSLWSATYGKGDKQLADFSSINQQTLFKSSPNYASSDRVTESASSGCVLSLLSTYQTQSSGVSVGPIIPSLDYSSPHLSFSKGLEGASSDSVFSTGSINKSHIYKGFHLGQEGFLENRPSRLFPFSLQ